MQIDTTSDRPIFLQIAEGIEDGILSDIFLEEQQIPSITDFSVAYKINPATALKGINLLVDEGVVFKKRGVGMFVAGGAKQLLRKKRQQGFYNHYVTEMVLEAKRLSIQREALRQMVDRAYDETQPEREESK